MYQRVDDNLCMTDVEACVRYPDSYILVRWDNMDSEIGEILFIADNMSELYPLRAEQDESYYGILEGLNLQRSLGGVVIGG